MFTGRKIILQKPTKEDAYYFQKWFMNKEFRHWYDSYMSVSLDMIEDEISKMKDIVEECKAELKAEGVEYDPDMKIDTMMRRSLKYSGSSTSSMTTTLPSAAATAILSVSPLNRRMGQRKKLTTTA